MNPPTDTDVVNWIESHEALVTYRPGLAQSRVIIHALHGVEFGRGATLREAVADAIQNEQSQTKGRS